MIGFRRLVLPGLLCILSWILTASALQSGMQEAARQAPQTPAPLSCASNIWPDAQCNSSTNCQIDRVRNNCRKRCNACRSYEVLNSNLLEHVASVVGSPHIKTFDKVRYNCNGVGEYILLENGGADNLRVHALIEKTREGGEVSVIKGVAMQDDLFKKIQISLFRERSASASNVRQCKVKFFLDGTRVFGLPFRPGGYFGLLGKRTFNTFRLQYKNGVDVRFQLRFHPDLGCFFDGVTVRLANSRVTEETRGMLGTPNNNSEDDLITKDGTNVTPATGASRFEEWYQYCSSNWCIPDISDSLFVDATAQLRTTCNTGTPYSGVDVETASSRIVEICGTDDACLVDAVSMSDELEGLSTLLTSSSIDISNRNNELFTVWPTKILLNTRTSVQIRINANNRPEILSEVERYNVYFVNARGNRTGRSPVVARRRTAGGKVFFAVRTTVKLTPQNPSLGFEAVPVIEGAEATRLMQSGSRMFRDNFLDLRDIITGATPTEKELVEDGTSRGTPAPTECQDSSRVPGVTSAQFCRSLTTSRDCSSFTFIPKLCPHTCLACPSFKLPSKGDGSLQLADQYKNSALVQGDPHIITFDGIRQDCHGNGEFLLTAATPRNGTLTVHGIFQKDGKAAFTKGLAIREIYNGRIFTTQVTLDLERSATGPRCAPRFFKGSQQISETKIAEGDGMYGMFKFDSRTYYMDNLMGMRIKLLIHPSKCFLVSNTFYLTQELSEQVQGGLLGKSNCDSSDDYNTRSFEPFLPGPTNRVEQTDYCRTVWCVRNISQSIFTYPESSFAEYQKCADRVDPSLANPRANATPPVLNVCGLDDDCVVDGFAGGGVKEAQQFMSTVSAQDEAAERESTLKVMPQRIIPGENTELSMSLNLGDEDQNVVNAVEGFMVFQLDPLTGEKTSTEPTTTLFRLGGASIFSGSAMINLPDAGVSRGFRAEPFLRAARTATERQAAPDISGLVFELRNAIRSFSEDSGVTIAEPNRLGSSAALWGFQHIITYDGVHYDCQGRGEFVLLEDSLSGLRIHALLSTQDVASTTVSVTTGLAMSNRISGKSLQVSLEHLSTGDVSNVNECIPRYLVDGEETTSGLDGSSGITANEFAAFAMSLTEQVQISALLQYSSTYGCYIGVVLSDVLPNVDSSKMRGILGSPTSRTRDDWATSDGEDIPIADNEDRRKQAGYDFCSQNWCIRSMEQSIFNYGAGSSFDSMQHCNEAYFGVQDFSAASYDLISTCGASNFACLSESMATGDVFDAVIGLNVQNQLEQLKRGVFTVSPLAVLSGVTSTLKFQINLTDLDAEDLPMQFNLYAMDEDMLQATGGALLSLTRDGTAQTFSAELSVTIDGNGATRSFLARAVFEGTGESNSRLLMHLVEAVRAYSTSQDFFEGTGESSSRLLMPLVEVVRAHSTNQDFFTVDEI